MRRFLITSEVYTGEAELHYEADGRLVLLDMTRTNMSADLVGKFKLKVPQHVDGLATAFTGKVVVVEADYEVTFDMFWKKYDKKINRKRCELLWPRMSKADQVAAYVGVTAYDKYLKRVDWRSKLDPENYLKNKTWENEYR